MAPPAGDNLLVKWQLLSDLLNCSVRMVAVRSSCGAVNDARLQCLEALKLANKLHAPGQYVLYTHTHTEYTVVHDTLFLFSLRSL